MTDKYTDLGVWTVVSNPIRQLVRVGNSPMPGQYIFYSGDATYLFHPDQKMPLRAQYIVPLPPEGMDPDKAVKEKFFD